MMHYYKRGFTVVELLIVIVVIAILASFVIVSYNGTQSQAREARIRTDLGKMRELVDAYKAEKGTYPITAAALNPDWGTVTARTDTMCNIGTQSGDWIPSLGTLNLPKSNKEKGVGGHPGCYMYVSDGTSYVISAWNMLDAPKTDTLYRRLGFRETDPSHANQFYICNHSAIGGVIGSYNASNDYYKRSLTISNIESCNETPPSGA